MRDFTEDLADLRRRVEDAPPYLRVDAQRADLERLEKEASRPDLWDDADAARRVTRELARVREDVELVDRLDRELEDTHTLFELGRDESDDSVEPEISAGIARTRFEPDRLGRPALYA